LIKHFAKVIFVSIKKIISMTECPVCGAEIQIKEGTVKGELLECAECGSELEVTQLDPVSLAEAPKEEEDWGE